MLKYLKNMKFLLLLADFIILIIASFAAYFVSNSLSLVDFEPYMIYDEMIIYIVLNMLSLYFFKVYQNIWKYARVIEFADCVFAIITASVISWTMVELFSSHKSHIYTILMVMFTIVGIILSRCVYCYIYSMLKHHDAKTKKNTMIIGAGAACREIVLEMMSSSACNYKPVVIVDDDIGKINKRFYSVPIAGTTEQIPALCKKYNVKYIIFAIPSCDSENKKRIMNICAGTGCDVKVMPYLHEIIDSYNLLEEIKPINIDDLLGREVRNLDNPLIAQTIKDKVCMVTGGGGSIGSELSRQIARRGPKKLIIVDIYENNAYDIQQELIMKYRDTLGLDVQIASVRDYAKMEWLFKAYRPDMVFHAAAHKHVPLMETNPEEAIKNNVFGTYNIASLAKKYKTEKFVLVSTDKAVNPTNIMGATKRCCEMIICDMAQKCTTTEFIAVRFGNVLGSNGSVIPLFEKQIAEKKPITVTHPDIIRYFMTIPEAVALILEAATIARGGEIFVLDMGEPVKILTLAENLIRMHGKEPYTDVKIEFTGLRPGEKLYEELLMDEEGLRSTANNRIFVGTQIKVEHETFASQLKELKNFAEKNDARGCIEVISQIVTTYKPNKVEEVS